MAQVAARAFGNVLAPRGRGGRLAIFCYHQVLEQRHPLHPGEPDVQDFASDVEIIGSVFHVLPLPEAVARMADGALPARAAALTFDDGYANNYQLAAPVLEAAGMSATFFIACGAVDGGIMWNDLVIEAAARRREPLILRDIVGVDASAAADAPPVEAVWRVLGDLRYRPLQERQTSAERIYALNVGETPPRLMMTREMVADLARRGFDIGGHTLRHPILTKVSDDEARAEIEGSQRWIEQVTGARPKSFAYPNGKPEIDFLEAHVRMVARAGFELAVSSVWNLARADFDRFRLPRIGPWWRQQHTLAGGLLRNYLHSRLA